jgi:dolichol-phosphate mannosyltransferase
MSETSQGDRGSGIDLSIIIPVMNEEENIAALAEEINAALQSLELRWECLWIDDGSTDTTLLEIDALCQRDARHQFLSHDGNHGQSMALYSGFQYARGAIMATLDGDGQNDPGDIPLLIDRLLEEDADMVNGWRRTRKDGLIRRLSSRLANRFRNWLTRDQVRDVGCSMRVFHRRCVQRIPVFNGMHRFLPTLVRIAGCSRIVEMPVHHRPRMQGRTKYGINNRLWRGLIDTLSVRWMRSRIAYPVVKSTSSEIMPPSNNSGGHDHEHLLAVPRVCGSDSILRTVPHPVDSERKSR